VYYTACFGRRGKTSILVCSGARRVKRTVTTAFVCYNGGVTGVNGDGREDGSTG